MFVVCVCVCRESGEGQERGATNERGESDNSIRFDRTKTVTFRASCPRRGERDMERTNVRKKGERARDARRNLPLDTNALLERQHPTEVDRSTEVGAERVEARDAASGAAARPFS